MKSLDHKTRNLQNLARLIRYWILTMTTEAGSGHPTSSLSAVELMTVLMFGGFFRADLARSENPNNDRLIFSKGHAAPLLYALYAAAGAIEEKELMTLRRFGSRLEGHPSMKFPYAEAPTGSLGQGLSIGIGMALNATYLDRCAYKTFVMLGDSEMAEGSNWEALQLAAHYKLDNLIGILDVNRLGQRGETMYGHRVKEYEKRIQAFGWETIVVNDGHDIEEVMGAYTQALRENQFVIARSETTKQSRPSLGGLPRSLTSPRHPSYTTPRNDNERPTMIIAKTVKGKGVSFLENKEGKHGKALTREECNQALRELGEVNKKVRGQIVLPVQLKSQKPKAKSTVQNSKIRLSEVARNYSLDDFVATREAYGNTLVTLGAELQNLVVLDAELSDSTRSEKFKHAFPDRFFEMYIAEQNMVGAAEGLAARGKIPFVSTFAAFFTRAFDQIRMAQYAHANIKFVGSHGGVSIGQDGPSQMGLEDLAMFRTLQNTVVFYPSDAVSMTKLLLISALHIGMVYLRSTREATPIVYAPSETFHVGGSKVLRKSKNDTVAVVAAGITLHEALAAYEELKKENIAIRVIDLYCIKPVDEKTLREAARATKAFIVVEDHVPEGGIADAVRSVFVEPPVPIYSLAVRKAPKSGTPEELLRYEEIDRNAIVAVVKKFLNVYGKKKNTS